MTKLFIKPLHERKTIFTTNVSFDSNYLYNWLIYLLLIQFMNSVDQHEKTLREWYVLSYQVKYYKFNTNTSPQCEHKRPYWHSPLCVTSSISIKKKWRCFMLIRGENKLCIEITVELHQRALRLRVVRPKLKKLKQSMRFRNKNKRTPWSAEILVTSSHKRLKGRHEFPRPCLVIGSKKNSRYVLNQSKLKLNAPWCVFPRLRQFLLRVLIDLSRYFPLFWLAVLITRLKYPLLNFCPLNKRPIIRIFSKPVYDGNKTHFTLQFVRLCTPP